MLGFTSRVVLALALGLGCAASAACEQTQLAIDLLVHPGGVTAHVREVERSCECTAGNFAAPGTCISNLDSVMCDCSPGPGACVDGLRIIRDGNTVGTGTVNAAGGGIGSVRVPLQSGDELEVTGCGGLARIPLNLAGPLPEPTVSVDFVSEEEGYRVSWTTAPAGASAYVGGIRGLSGWACHVEGDTASLMVDAGSSAPSVTVHALQAPLSVDTELGVARVWTGTQQQASP